MSAGSFAGQWTVTAQEIALGKTIELPPGSECMRSGLGSEIWYHPGLDRSFHLYGSNQTGWLITAINGAFCPKCQERRSQYREGRR